MLALLWCRCHHKFTMPPHRVFSHDNILPLLAVVVDPQVHIVGHFMKMGSLYNLLHGKKTGEH